jgi:triosephosphate isomerase
MRDHHDHDCGGRTGEVSALVVAEVGLKAE